jgi:hypothetical protein
MLARGTLRRDDDSLVVPVGRLLEPGQALELAVETLASTRSESSAAGLDCPG